MTASWRRLAAWGAYVGYLFLTLFALVFVAHWMYVHRGARMVARAPSQEPPATTDADTLARLGWLQPPEERGTSFVRFAPTKPAGTFRIGCFGDSFTWGSEVADGYEFPARLQRMLDVEGRRIEVLNFGVPAYGFHQAFMMLEEVGARYDLDVAVIVARDFWPGRDLTFAWAERKLHARYVLAGEGVEIVQIPGSTPVERFREYTRLFPRGPTLRYERLPPAILRAILPAGRTLANPFYYRDDDERTEALETYRRLLTRFSEHRPARRLVLAVPAGGLYEAVAGAPLDGIDVQRLVLGDSFLYRMPFGHGSPWMNQLIAEQLAPVVSPRAGGSTEVHAIEVGDPEGGIRAIHTPVAQAPVDDAAGVVTMGDTRVAALVEYQLGRLEVPYAPPLPADVRALLAVRLPGRGVADALLVPLHGELPKDGVVLLSGPGGARRLVLESVTRLDTNLSLGVLALCDGSALADVLDLGPGMRCAVPDWGGGIQPPGRVAALRVNGRAALRAVARPDEGGALLVPADRF